MPLAAAALQFPLGHSAVASVLTGVRSVSELHENVRNFDRALPADLWAEIVDRGLLSEAAAPYAGRVVVA